MTTRPAGSTARVPPKLLRPLASFFSGAVGALFGSMASIFFAMYVDASGRTSKPSAPPSAMLLTLSVARAIGYAAVHELTLDSFILCAAAIPAMGIGLLVGEDSLRGLVSSRFSASCARRFFFAVFL